MIRMSTAQIFRQGVGAIQDQQSKLSRTALELASGRRLLVPSDDPAAAAQSVELKTAMATAQQYQKNITLGRGRLTLEESTLQQVGDNLQRVRELALQGNNDTLSSEDRGVIAAEINQRLEELLDLANTQDATGEYIFAGNRSQTEPFITNESGSFSYSGDDAQRLLQISAARQVPINDAGSNVFVKVPQGNGTFIAEHHPANTGSGIIGPGSVTDHSLWKPDTYTVSFTAPNTYEVHDSAGAQVSSGNSNRGETIAFSGIQTKITGNPAAGDRFIISAAATQDIFSTYQNLITALESPGTDDTSEAKMHNAIGRTLVNLDQAMEQMRNTRSSVGARLSSLDTESEFNENTVLSLRETLSTLEDVDYAEAVSRLQLQLTGLQAAQQSYLKLQEFTLFDFLR